MFLHISLCSCKVIFCLRNTFNKLVTPNFTGALDKGGVGALELVAMDMKAR